MNPEDLQAQAQDEEVGLPRAALNKLIKDTLPHVRVANETRDLIYNCCLEYIKAVGSSANRHCAEEQRKTIGAEHVIKALEELGFGPEYVEAANSVMDNCRQQAARRLRRQNSRLDKLGIPEEELLRQQQELFQKAREEQAEADQAQLAHFQQLMASAQQQQQHQQHQAVFNPAAFLAAQRSGAPSVSGTFAMPSTAGVPSGASSVATLVQSNSLLGSTSTAVEAMRVEEMVDQDDPEGCETKNPTVGSDDKVSKLSGASCSSEQYGQLSGMIGNPSEDTTPSTLGRGIVAYGGARIAPTSSVMDEIDEDYDED